MIGYVQREGSLSRHNYYIKMDYTKPFFDSVKKMLDLKQQKV